MTLVAAFKAENIPILIGDFLLTDNDRRSNHAYLPTAPNLSRERAVGTSPRLHGLRKKIHLLADNLAVGFTGSLIPGRQLLQRLTDRFESKRATIADLRQLLANSRFVGRHETALVGWICENRPLCFRWSGREPENFQLCDEAIIGSGASHFRSRILPANWMGSNVMQSALGRATYQTVCKLGRVMSQELLDGSTLSNAYGFGAEALLWNGARFGYLPSVGYTFWNIIILADNSIEAAPGNVVALYRGLSDYSILQVSHLHPTLNPAGDKSPDTYLNLITSLSGKGDEIDPLTLGFQKIEPDIWFSGFRVFNPIKRSLGSCFVVSERTEDQPFLDYKNSLLSFNAKELLTMLSTELLN